MTIKYWRLVIFFFVSVSMVRADQIEMQNGDRYSGSVLSMTPDTVVLKSDVLGEIKVPRIKVSTITLGSAANASHLVASTNNPASARRTLQEQSTAATPDALRQLGANTNLVQQIRKQFLGDADPQANDKFDDLLTGLMTGKVDIDGLRAQAKSAADQLRSMKKDMGGDAGETLDTYLAVLDNFLSEETPPPAVPATNNAQGAIIIR